MRARRRKATWVDGQDVLTVCEQTRRGRDVALRRADQGHQYLKSFWNSLDSLNIINLLQPATLQSLARLVERYRNAEVGRCYNVNLRGHLRVFGPPFCMMASKKRVTLTFASSGVTAKAPAASPKTAAAMTVLRKKLLTICPQSHQAWSIDGQKSTLADVGKACFWAAADGALAKRTWLVRRQT